MLGQYRRQWADISLPLDQCLMLAEIHSPHSRAVDVLRLVKKNCWKSVTVKSDVLNIIFSFTAYRDLYHCM